MKIILFFLSFILLGCTMHKEVFERREFVLGTFGEIICISKREICQRGVEKAYKEIRRLEDILSYFKKESDISLLNHSQGKPVKVREETFAILERVKEISQKTEGAFDITVSPLLKIWGFYDREIPLKEPDPKLIEKTLLLVGEDKIVLDRDKKMVSFKNESVRIDLGGIAKGYIVDRIVNILKNEGIKSGLVNLGGDIFCFGEGRNKKGWRIGVQDPLNRENIIAILNIRDKAIVTSGQYENFRELNGKRFGHIIDPRTGYPVENNLLSVTVVAEDCLTADALSTAIFVLGKEKGISILEKFQAEGIIISDEDFWVSPGLRKKVQR